MPQLYSSYTFRVSSQDPLEYFSLLSTSLIINGHSQFLITREIYSEVYVLPTESFRILINCLMFSDVVRLCSLEYIEGDCKQETVRSGKSSTTNHACVCNTDFCNGADRPMSTLSLTIGLILGILVPLKL